MDAGSFLGSLAFALAYYKVSFWPFCFGRVVMSTFFLNHAESCSHCPPSLQIPPVKVIDKCIEIAVDILVPGKGTGESSWMMKQYRNLEQTATRQQKELDIRNEIRKWDEEVPWFHTELIVRCAAGVVARGLVLSIYQMIRGQERQKRA